MEERPAVPPKDARYSARMAVDLPATAVTSGSKRKRHADDGNGYDIGLSDFDAADTYEHTPKRSRPHLHHSEASASEDNAGAKPRLVRKKGSRNLSNLNLRHAAKTQTLTQAAARQSKFQEGSLTDRPSVKPPSFFTRMARAVNGDPAHVDALMEDYHEDMRTTRDSAVREGDFMPQHVTNIAVEAAKKDESRGFFQFGRQLAANFRPVTLWKNIWGQSKDELAKEHMEEAARKAQQKADAEAKYAEMKQAGQLGLHLVGTAINGSQSYTEETSTPQDSAVAFDGLQSSLEPSRSTSAATVLRPLADSCADRSESNVFESTNNLAKGLKDRLHMKKPSLTNIKSDLKRMRSDMSLVGNRESSASISPVKNDFGFSALKRSTSRLDLKKSASKVDLRKQQKLSKRVSDLENKLQLARKDLDEALVEASPMPKLSGKYERFTPSATITRPKFLPGKLPSLPSERVLMAEQGIDMNENDKTLDEVQPRKAMDLSLDEFMAEREDEEETIKVSRARRFLARATSLFDLRDNNNIENEKQPPAHDKTEPEKALEVKHYTEATENMDPNSISELTGDATPQATKQVDYASLDAKLKALDANVKTARKAAKPKKRKSGVADEDKTFKPARTESDDELEWEATPKKKQRKSSSGKNEISPPNKRSTNTDTQRSPPKKGKGGGAETNPLNSSPAGKKDAKEPVVEQRQDEDVESHEEYSADEAEETRTSMDSQGVPLDPVYEEEEETPASALNDEPAAKATPTHHGRKTNRSRSNSPQKRGGSVLPGTEEQMITRAARAAQEHPGRQGGSRSVSPPPPNSWTGTTIMDETVTVVPGANGVPQLPRGANGSFESLDVFQRGSTEVEVLSARGPKQRDAFEWPDDVF